VKEGSVVLGVILLLVGVYVATGASATHSSYRDEVGIFAIGRDVDCEGMLYSLAELVAIVMVLVGGILFLGGIWPSKPRPAADHQTHPDRGCTVAGPGG